MGRKKNKIWIAAVVGGLALAWVFITFRNSSSGALGEAAESMIRAEHPKVTVYRSPTCGCCGNYVAYLKKKGFEVETEFVDSTNEIQNQYGVPGNLRSCHTTVIGGYAVEGHVPIEAVAKLLKERPAIKGIAIPGMPSGSPGMPGSKRDAFSVYSFEEDGRSDIFISI